MPTFARVSATREALSLMGDFRRVVIEQVFVSLRTRHVLNRRFADRLFR